jgi:hypothetical protein
MRSESAFIYFTNAEESYTKIYINPNPKKKKRKIEGTGQRGCTPATRPPAPRALRALPTWRGGRSRSPLEILKRRRFAQGTARNRDQIEGTKPGELLLLLFPNKVNSWSYIIASLARSLFVAFDRLRFRRRSTENKDSLFVF